MSKKIDIPLFLLTIIFLIYASFIDVSTYAYTIFLVIIFTVGIPHGALDHIIYFKKKATANKNVVLFYVQYLLLIIITGILWFIFPIASFIVFLLISAYHFGQSQLFYLNGNQVVRQLLFISWGAFLLSTIIYYNYSECFKIFSSFEMIEVDKWMTTDMWLITMLTSGLLTIFGMVYIAISQKLATNKLFFELALLTLFLLLSVFTTAVITFTMYFGIWHSLRSLIVEFKTLKNNIFDYNFKIFLKDLVPFSLAAFIFLAFTYFYSADIIPTLSPYMIFIIIISMLTVPHFLIMRTLYDQYSVNLS
ncbi:MAG: Brp/Blh family beta-carotene 15,15'-dioxygenase [Fulvivirga sp.]